MLLTREACQVVTVLGSCVAVTLFSRRLRAAAICHVTLPEAPARWDAADRAAGNRFRFASDTIPEMLSRFRAIGARPCELEARIFGGSCRISAGGEKSIYAVGQTNLDRVRQLLEEANVPVRQQDTGLSSSLRLIFDTSDGQTVATRSASLPFQTTPPLA